MPNWCNNSLTITGGEDVIIKIKDWYEEYQSNKTELGLFGLFYPLPKDLKDTTFPCAEPNKILIDKYGADNWYDWQLQNWGCKWDAGEVCLKIEDKTSVSFSFDTPWSPPIQFYEKLSRDYPKLYIRASYYEPGVDFCGTFDSNGGEHTLSITDIKSNCLRIYGDTHKDYVDEFKFRERLESIYQTDFSISKDIDVYEIFDDYYFEENLTDKKFCELYKIKENQ